MKIKIKKGADIKLEGEAKKEVVAHNFISEVVLRPTDFLGLNPKLSVKVNQQVEAGEALFYDKECESVKYTSPLGGKVTEIERGEKRKILAVKVAVAKEQKSKTFSKADPKTLTVEQIKQNLLDSGAWAFITQRPYAVVANPNDTPKAIFISAFDTSPLAPDYNFLLEKEINHVQTAIEALLKLCPEIHFNVCEKTASNSLKSIKGVKLNTIEGAHPAGNVGVQINKIAPLNKGEIVWTINALDLVTIGLLFDQGKFIPKRVVAFTGSDFNAPKYYETVLGANLSNVFDNQIQPTSRCISGNALTGINIGEKGALGFYHHQVTVLPECTAPDFMGWNKPQFKKLSFSRTGVSWLFPNKKYKLNTSMNGEERAFVVTGEYEKFFPMDIYPVYLLKAMITKNLDLMESLGIYEVAPEDFALCEFACTSKIPLQEIVKEALMLVKKECS